MSFIGTAARSPRTPAFVLLAGAWLATSSALGQTLGYAPASSLPFGTFERIGPDSANVDGLHEPAERLRRRVIAYRTHEPAGTVIVDTPNTQLFYVLGGGKAISYGIGVGREGFTWSGVQTIARKQEWPDWHPPQEMLERQPYLPRMMAGGPGNPLGARALYLGSTIYRIHGTNSPETIGGNVSSGCIRMLNQDVIDLYSRVHVGTRVVVLPSLPRQSRQSVSESRPNARTASVSAADARVRAFGLY
jgi:lipoprotein-anchoring transpeptidase ErfK/SrfK